MNKGLRFEYDTVKEIDESTNFRTRVACGGGSSGNIKTDQPDLVIMRQRSEMEIDVYAVEMKNTSQDRIYIDADDLEQLWNYSKPDWITPLIVVKFSNRQAVIIDLSPYIEYETGQYVSLSNKASALEVACHAADACPKPFDARVTDSGSLALTKPSTDEWPSTQKGLNTGDLLIKEFNL